MSTKGIGRLIQTGVAKETTRGTAIGSATYWLPWNDLTLDEKKEFAVDAQAYGVIEDSVQLTQTKAWAQGSLSGNILDQSFGLILYSMFGTLNLARGALRREHRLRQHLQCPRGRTAPVADALPP